MLRDRTPNIPYPEEDHMFRRVAEYCIVPVGPVRKILDATEAEKAFTVHPIHLSMCG